jgi:hypothetical protein
MGARTPKGWLAGAQGRLEGAWRHLVGCLDGTRRCWQCWWQQGKGGGGLAQGGRWAWPPGMVSVGPASCWLTGSAKKGGSNRQKKATNHHNQQQQQQQQQ